jgi:hypothetical protein
LNKKDSGEQQRRTHLVVKNDLGDDDLDDTTDHGSERLDPKCRPGRQLDVFGRNESGSSTNDAERAAETYIERA